MQDGCALAEFIWSCVDIMRCEQMCTDLRVPSRLSLQQTEQDLHELFDLHPLVLLTEGFTLAEHLAGNLTLSLTRLHQGHAAPQPECRSPFNFLLRRCQEKCFQTAGAQSEAASTGNIERQKEPCRYFKLSWS